MKARIALVLACLSVVRTGAQSSNDWWPPRILMIEREEAQPGKMAQYESNAVAYAQALERARVATHRVALSMAVGGDRERIYLSGYDSMEALERAREDWGAGPLRPELEGLREKASESLASRQTLLAVYRPDLSYRPAGFNLSEIRYVLMNTHFIPSAQEARHAADVKAQMRALNEADVNRHWYVYQVIAGAPVGTYILIKTYRSLREMDGFIDKPDRAFESFYLSSVTPEIGIFSVNNRTSYPK